jgi:hypothetical protein
VARPTAVPFRSLKQLTTAALVCLAGLALLPAAARAATVANPGFELGTLSGWTVSDTYATGTWFAYSGTDSPWELAHPFTPVEPGEKVALRQVPPPPEGQFAALSDQEGPGTHILYQDLALEAGATHTLAMTVYYRSLGPIAVPAPDSLDSGPPDTPSAEIIPNQQYRVEVIRPAAPIDTVNPADILATVFRTNPGDPNEHGPLRVTADLSAFAGQTVRLRLAEVDNTGQLNAGVDSVVVDSRALPIRLGKLRRNAKKGTAKLPIFVPGPGRLHLDDFPPSTDGIVQPGWEQPVRGKGDKLKRRVITVTAARRVLVPLVPTARGRTILRKKHKLSVRARIGFLPSGSGFVAEIEEFRGKLRLKPPRARRERGR